MRWKLAGGTFCFAVQQREQPGQMRKMAGQQNVASLGAQTIPDPHRRIVGLQIPCRSEWRERVARTPQCFSGLPRAQFAAVPHDIRASATPRRFGRNLFDARPAGCGQRSSRIHVGSDCFAVMNQKQPQAMAC